MTTIVDGAAGFWRVMYCAEVLPFRGTHFRTTLCCAWGIVGEESNDDIVGLDGEEAAELIQPKIAVVGSRCFWAIYLRRGSKLDSRLASYWSGEAGRGVAGEAAIEGK